VTFALDVFAGDRRVAQIGHDPLADTWSLLYAQAGSTIPASLL